MRQQIRCLCLFVIVYYELLYVLEWEKIDAGLSVYVCVCAWRCSWVVDGGAKLMTKPDLIWYRLWCWFVGIFFAGLKLTFLLAPIFVYYLI